MEHAVPVYWLLVAVGIMCVALLGWWRAATHMARGNRRRQQWAQRGEDGAVEVLAAAGFTVVDHQVMAEWTVWLDGEPVDIRCRADLLVEGDDGRYIAEVKTGSRAIDPTNPATRRQLLEYQLAFPVEGLLLVDMEERRVVTVAFDLQSRGDFIFEYGESIAS
jgi:hypothetical protein